MAMELEPHAPVTRHAEVISNSTVSQAPRILRHGTDFRGKYSASVEARAMSSYPHATHSRASGRASRRVPLGHRKACRVRAPVAAHRQVRSVEKASVLGHVRTPKWPLQHQPVCLPHHPSTMLGRSSVQNRHTLRLLVNAQPAR